MFLIVLTSALTLRCLCHAFVVQSTSRLELTKPGFILNRISTVLPRRTKYSSQRQPATTGLAATYFYNDFGSFSDNKDHNGGDEDDDEEEDEDIDLDSLGDWRTFRRNLAEAAASGGSASSSSLMGGLSTEVATGKPTTASSVSKSPSMMHHHHPRRRPRSVSKENEELLQSQNAALAAEYTSSVWAHEIATPEVGGLVVRLPLEVEIYSNAAYSLTGRQFRTQHGNLRPSSRPSEFYPIAQRWIEKQILHVAETAANEEGQIDAAELDENVAELLQLYLDNQESWQEVGLVLERNETVSPKSAGGNTMSRQSWADSLSTTTTTTTLILNRPMALKLTQNLAQMVVFGVFSGPSAALMENKALLYRFVSAFGHECAVYIGGPDHQDAPAEMIHGHADLPLAKEIAPGTGIFRGGCLVTTVQRVLSGQYRPLDFRFFIGKHVYPESALDVAVRLHKYQPVASARSLVLKQCLSLPKPLWHEVLELCGGDLAEYSNLELLKRDDLRFQIVDEDDLEDDDDAGPVDDEEDGIDEDYDFDEIIDELDELKNFDDDDGDDFSSRRNPSKWN